MATPSPAPSVVQPGLLRQCVHTAQLCLIGIKRSQLTRMAAALSYRTIFGIIPVLVVGLVFTATFAKEEQVRGWIEKVLQFAGLSQIYVPSSGASGVGAGRLDQWIGDMVGNVRGLKWEIVGFVGLGTLIYAAISMLVEIEEAFNQICNAPGGRSWTRRITQYWTLLTLGSLFLVGSFSIPSQLEKSINTAMTYAKQAVGIDEEGPRPPVQTPPEADLKPSPAPAPAVTAVTADAAAAAESAPTRTWLAKIIASGFSIVVSVALFMTLFCVVPNTRVHVLPAAVGALFSAGLWELAKQGFGLYVTSSKGYTTLYGALALLPMFLIWIYVTWIVVLFGLHVTHALQAYGTAKRQGLTQSVLVALGLLVEQHGTRRQATHVDPASFVLVMTAVAERFAAGRPSDHAHVAEATGLDEAAASQMLDQLAGAGLLHRLAEGGDGSSYALARPPASIQLGEILGMAANLAERVKSPAGARVLETLARARQQAVEGRTLADAMA
jgi:membrane protein